MVFFVGGGNDLSLEELGKSFPCKELTKPGFIRADRQYPMSFYTTH